LKRFIYFKGNGNWQLYNYIGRPSEILVSFAYSCLFITITGTMAVNGYVTFDTASDEKSS